MPVTGAGVATVEWGYSVSDNSFSALTNEWLSPSESANWACVPRLEDQSGLPP